MLLSLPTNIHSTGKRKNRRGKIYCDTVQESKLRYRKVIDNPASTVTSPATASETMLKAGLSFGK